MSYGQLIWDVPKIENIDRNDYPEKKGKLVEEFLKKCKLEYVNKKNSYMEIDGRGIHIYEYDTENSNKNPFFNYTEPIKNNTNVFFLIGSKSEKWNGYTYTRKGDSTYFYLFKYQGGVENTGEKVTWDKLKICCNPIGKKSTKKLFQ